ncbi:MAG: matrixin family metalloprotease [Gallionella sp.]
MATDLLLPAALSKRSYMTLTPAIIQRAQSAVLVTVDGIEYAIVSDDNHFTMDPYWQAMYEAPTFLWTPSGAPLAIGGSTTAKKVAIGGKLGIIADPFGKQGEAKYLGATLPLDGYGIINLGVSENGTVLIGQLKGSYSSNLGIANNAAPGSITPGWNIAFPSQSHAWNVADLIHAALAMPDKDRMSKHINVQAYPNIEQLVKNNVGLVAGTFFDDGPVVVNVNDGRMGDVVEVDLKKLAADVIARELLKLAKDLPETAMTDAQRNALVKKRDEVIQWSVQNFTLNADTIDDSDTAAFKLIRATGNSASSVIADPYTRGGKDSDVTGLKFKDTGRMYLAPNITATDETTLRNGGRITDKVTTLLFKFQAQNDIGLWEWRQGIVTVTAKDIPAVQTFFGDRPLDNPGYSAFTLHGEVSVAAQQNKTIDVLDVYRVEQRLKYLGYPAIYTGMPQTDNTLQEFKVDGTFDVKEKAALKLFEKVVRYDATTTGATHTSFANTTNGTADNSNGADGMIEADTTSVGQGKTTSDWLNAYNAPHWMQLFASRTPPQGENPPATFEKTNAHLSKWTNSQIGTTNTKVENFGTSWMWDLMAAVSQAPTGLLGNRTLQFNGATDANYGFTPQWNGAGIQGQHATHDLGMAFDLGIGDNVSKIKLGSAWNANDGNQYNHNEPLTVSELAANQIGWSINQAISQSVNNSQLPQTSQYVQNGVQYSYNRQQFALGNFLALYSVTRDNVVLPGEVAGPPSPLGSRLGLTFTNGTAAQKELIRNALFGDGTNTNGLISKVLVGGTTSTQNPLLNFNRVLKNLAIDTAQSSGHQNHFHIYLNPPAVQGIVKSANLLGSDVMDGGVESVAVTPTQTTYSALSGAEETVMLAFTVPAVPPQAPTVMIAQAVGQNANPTQNIKTITFCLDKQSLVPDSAPNAFSPVNFEFLRQIGKPYTGTVAEAQQYNVTLLEVPKHGVVNSIDDFTGWIYMPEKGYEGADRAIYLVESQGKQYKVVINFWVVEVLDEDRPAQYCDSVDFGASNGLSTPPTGLKPLSMSDFSAWQTETQFASLLNTVSNITITFTDLAGGALGQTTGNAITLDTNAAGNNWYIDTTPSDNSEYLPTSNPNEWVAKAGSAAAGKMDMLTVLLHEYGHALGIDHNADAHDYMGTTLTAGVRRLPTPDEMALMGQLIAQAKSGLDSGLVGASPARESLTGRGYDPLLQGSTLPSNVPAPFPTLPLGGMSLAFAGLLQRNRYGSLNAVLNNSTLTQYAVAANSTLTNGSLNNGNGWATQGSVNIGNGVATLNEVSTSQTRLNQVFMVNANDRYLSFTLSGTALDDLNGAPDDAFEVVLLDANSGASLLGGNGLTHSDAFLNLQVLHKINNLKLTIPL